MTHVWIRDMHLSVIGVEMMIEAKEVAEIIQVCVKRRKP